MVEMNLTFVNFELSRSFNPWRLGGANTYSLNKFIPHILFITKFQFLFNFFWHNQIHTFLTPFWFHLPEYIEKVKKSTEWVQQSNWTIDIGLAISAAIDNDWCWQPGQMGAMCDQIYSGIDANGKFSIISAFESYFRFFFFIFKSNFTWNSNFFSLLISGLQKIGNERLRAIKSKNKWMRNAANTQFECSLSVWIYCEEYRWTMVSCHIEINLERGKRCA